MTTRKPSVPDDSRRATRREFGRSGAAFALSAAAAAGLAPSPAHAATRFDSRARYLLHNDFTGPPNGDVIVPWDWVWFQRGTDFALMPDGKILFATHGLYECVVSADWKMQDGLDYDLRQIGLRLQRKGQPDLPMDPHERIGFFNTPGSDPPQMARGQIAFGPVDVPLGATVGVEVKVAPAGTRVGDMAVAGHSRVSLKSMPIEHLRALIVQAKVIDDDTVSVSFYNPSVAEGIRVRAGNLKVIAMTAQLTRGGNGDAWQIVHSASVEIMPGDRVYTVLWHRITGTVLQTSDSTYLQIDRVA